MVIEILEILFNGFCVGLASSVTVGPVAVLCIQRTLSKGHLSGLVSGFGIACADALLAILAFSVFAMLKPYIDQYNTIIQICAGVFVIIVGIFIFFKNPVPQIRKNRAGKKKLWQDFASMFGFTLANFVVIIPYILAFFAMFNVELSGANVLDTPEPVVEVVEEVDTLATPIKPIPVVKHINGAVEKQPVMVVEEAPAVVEQSLSDVDNDDKRPSKVDAALLNVLIISGFLLGAMLWWLALTSIINLFRKGFRPRHMLTINHIAGIVIGILGFYTLLSVLIK